MPGHGHYHRLHSGFPLGRMGPGIGAPVKAGEVTVSESLIRCGATEGDVLEFIEFPKVN